MPIDTFVFFAIIGTLCGAIATSAAESTPYQHRMECVRRASQNPLILAIAQQIGSHGTPGGESLLDPTTMWIRVALACVAAVMFAAFRRTDPRER